MCDTRQIKSISPAPGCLAPNQFQDADANMPSISGRIMVHVVGDAKTNTLTMCVHGANKRQSTWMPGDSECRRDSISQAPGQTMLEPVKLYAPRAGSKMRSGERGPQVKQTPKIALCHCRQRMRLRFGSVYLVCLGACSVSLS